MYGMPSTMHVSVTAEEDPRGQKILLFTSMPCELLTNSPHFKLDDMAMSLFNVMWHVATQFIEGCTSCWWQAFGMLLSAVVVPCNTPWGAASLTLIFQPKLTWVAHCRHGKHTCMRRLLYSPFHAVYLHIWEPIHKNSHQHTFSHPPPFPPPTYLIVDSVRCVHVWCPLQYTRLASLTDLLQGCKVVSKSSTAVFTGGGGAWTLHVHAQWANCTDRQTNMYTDGRQYLTNIHTPLSTQRYLRTFLHKQNIVSKHFSAQTFVTCCSTFRCEPCIHSLNGSLHSAWTDRETRWITEILPNSAIYHNFSHDPILCYIG